MALGWRRCRWPATTTPTTTTSVALLILLVALLPASTEGHGFLFEPPSRNYAKSLKGQEHCPHCLQSGGPGEVKGRGSGVWPSSKDPASHGLCGDPKQGGGPLLPYGEQTYVTSTPIERNYTAGSVVTFRVAITAHHQGHYQFRICDRGLDSFATAAEGQACLDQWVLEREPPPEDCIADDSRADCQPLHPAQKTRWYLPPHGDGTPVAGQDWADSSASATVSETHSMRFRIPQLSCSHCTLQWWWSSANSCLPDEGYFTYFKYMQSLGWSASRWSSTSVSNWANCQNSCCSTGGTFGEEFWNCADIQVLTAGPTSAPVPTPPTQAPATAVPEPTPLPTTAPVPAPPTQAPATAAPKPTPPPTLAPVPVPPTQAPSGGGACADLQMQGAWAPYSCEQFSAWPAYCGHAEVKRACCFCGGGHSGPVPAPAPCTHLPLEGSWRHWACDGLNAAQCGHQAVMKACCFCPGGGSRGPPSPAPTPLPPAPTPAPRVPTPGPATPPPPAPATPVPGGGPLPTPAPGSGLAPTPAPVEPTPLPGSGFAPTPAPAVPTPLPGSSPAPTPAPAAGPAPSPAGTPINVCYFTNWARYRSGLINTGKDIFEMGVDGSLCTHFMYGFAKVEPNGDIRSNDPNADHPSGHEGQQGLCPDVCDDPDFKPDWGDPSGVRCDWPCSPGRDMRGYEGMNVGMKLKNPGIKTLISVGGWNFNDCGASPSATNGQGSATCEIFSNLAASEASARSFARKAIAFCRLWGFDGFDLDWEYPVKAGHNSNVKPFVDQAEDYQNYITLLRLMKEEFAAEGVASGKEVLLLTAAVGVGKSTVDTAYDIPAMSQHLDLINLMAYDLHGGWEPQTGCNAPLYATAEDEALASYPLSVSWAVKYWLDNGAPASKLTLGIGTYGRGWQLADPEDSGFNAPTVGSSVAGASTGEAGYLSYYEILDRLQAGATRVYDHERQCPYILTSSGEWIGYDDVESVQAKVAFARSLGLGGTMVWALDLDDFAGAYSGGTKYPLVSLLLGSGGPVPVPPTPAPSASGTAPPATTLPVTTPRATTSAAAATTPSPPSGPLSCSACKQKCTEACGAAWTQINQCWGSPRFIQCECGDGTTHEFAGCPCENSQCPTAPVPTPQPEPATPAPQPATPTPQPQTSTPPPAPPAPQPVPSGTFDELMAALRSSNSQGVFQYDTGTGWADSDVYTWPDMVKAVELMAITGIGSMRLWIGEGGANAYKYGLVNIAAFLAQCMQETIQYNACDENNWSDKAVVQAHGGSAYSATSACGQMHQSYQDYTCSAEEDALAGGQMACPVDPDMELRAQTQAQWYGAPAKLFCAPRSKVPHAPRWDYSAPWCAPPSGWGHVPPFADDVPLDEYFAYVKDGGSCKDYTGIKTGGWTYQGEGCDGTTCPGSPAPLFGQPNGRTDVEGCCWWGRGVIQTTGTCNFGKLNYYMGKRAADEGRQAAYPEIDFCKDPGSICSPDGPPELKWVAGFFYWLNAVQPYSAGGWVYLSKLKEWVDGGMRMSDTGFIDGASGIVNRGCHNPPACGTGELHAGGKRAQNFRKVLSAMGLLGASLTEATAAEVGAHPFAAVEVHQAPRLRGASSVAARKRGLRGAFLFQQAHRLESACAVEEGAEEAACAVEEGAEEATEL